MLLRRRTGPGIGAVTRRRSRACRLGLHAAGAGIYYHCTRCQVGFCPRDRRAAAGVVFACHTGVLRMTGSTAALVSFEESSALLHELAGVEVSVSQVQRAAESLGAEIAADERVCVERMAQPAPTMYLGMDGTGVPMRPSEGQSRTRRKQAGWFRKNPARGQSRHGVERRIAG